MFSVAFGLSWDEELMQGYVFKLMDDCSMSGAALALSTVKCVRILSDQAPALGTFFG